MRESFNRQLNLRGKNKPYKIGNGINLSDTITEAYRKRVSVIERTFQRSLLGFF